MTFKRFQLLPFLLLGVWFLMQMFFLTADPDGLADIHTRGAWTDEGLYSGTARNFLNTGEIDPYENSLYTRGPLFTYIQIPIFYIFGQHLATARLLVLATVIISLLLFFIRSDTRLIGIFLLLTGFTQYHLFHFSHYAMAEMMGTSFILIAVFFILLADLEIFDKRKGVKWLFFSSVMLMAAYAAKVQFLYIAFLLPGYTLIRALPFIGSKKAEGSYRWQQFGWSVLFTAAWLIIYYLAWYLPNREFYNYVMTREVDGRYHNTLGKISSSVRFNFTHLLFVSYLKPLIFSGAISLLGGGLWLILRPTSWTSTQKALFVAGIIWFIGELHKIPMTYMPHRYLVSAYTSIALVVSVFLSVVASERKAYHKLSVTLAVVLTLLHLPYIYKSYQNRTYDLREVNSYLKGYDWTGETITGAWGPSCAWGTKAKVFPVWYGFVNDDRVMDAKIVIAEDDQEDSDQSMLNQGIDITAETDSARCFSVWRYNVCFHWISKNIQKIEK